MYMKKIPAVVLLCIIGALLFTVNSYAVELNVSGNGAGSDNSVNINSSNTTTLNQSNQGSVTNDVNAGANTGGNNTDGGSVNTGGANIFVKIKNLFNSNTADVDCCPQGASPTPTVFDPGKPTPTPTTSANGSGSNPPGNGSGNKDSSSNGGTGGSNPGAVLGLSATAGDGKDQLWFYIAGLALVASGAALIRRPKKLHA